MEYQMSVELCVKCVNVTIEPSDARIIIFFSPYWWKNDISASRLFVTEEDFTYS